MIAFWILRFILDSLDFAVSHFYGEGYSSCGSCAKSYCFHHGWKSKACKEEKLGRSIDNFKRDPTEVNSLMNLMREKIEELLQQESILTEYGVRLYFVGNLKLLPEPVRAAAEKAMRVTSCNNQRALLICVAYTSRDEIVNAVQESCKDKLLEVESSKEAKVSNGVIAGIDDGLIRNGIDVNAEDLCKDMLGATKEACTGVIQGVEGDEEKDGGFVSCVHKHCDKCSVMIDRIEESKYELGELPAIKLVDIEKHMYMAVAPDPDILIRTSGETRLSNFLLWQTSTCPLYSPTALWPDIGLWHLVWIVLNFQRHHHYLEKKKKHF
ncbi:hypothetical protein L6164_020250 [Bauhinia variegata]|uniref:Uncharacterized protein n=1 Tax=Bauhinia variegata TaxID=167791 RepID=A0ACB9MUU0_BAUVA|nr:hypothetical protein L6164_020250 [Bauhinia variegata]